MESCDRCGIGQLVAATFAAPLDGNIKRRPEDNVVDRHCQRLERLQEPRPDDAIQYDKVAAGGISFCSFCQDVDYDSVLFMGFGQVGRDSTIFDEVPEIVSMKVHFGRPGFSDERLGCCGFSGPGRTG